MMRRVVLTAALVGLLAAPAMAEEVSPENTATAVVSGHIGGILVDLTNPGFETEPGDASGYLLGADGYFNHWFTGNVALQGDFNGELSGPLGFWTDESAYATWLNGAAHLAYRDPAQFGVALFGALQSASYRYVPADPVDASTVRTSYALLGVEGQAYIDDITLYGQAGVALNIDPEPNTNGGSWRYYGDFAFVRGVLRYFPTDNLKLSVEGLYGVGSVGYESQLASLVDVPATIASVKLGADWRPDDQDFSLFGAYQASLNTQEISNTTRSSLTHRVVVGMKFDFGADSLKTRDRQGVTWDVPQIAGLVGAGQQLNFCFEGDCDDYVPPPP